MIGRRILFIVLGVLVLMALTATVAWADNGDTPTATTATGTDEGSTADVLLKALAPIIAIATAIERILEMFWERWEKAKVWPNKNGVKDTKSKEYIAIKVAGSHWLGTLFAAVAIGLTNARFFRLLGLDVLFSSFEIFDASIGGIFDSFTIGTLVDWVMTATIIGWGGTELTHSIIEGLSKGRSLWKEMREVQEGQKSIVDAKFFNSYIAPELERRGISTSMLRQAFQTLKSVGVSPDKLISSMTIGKVDELLGNLEADPETAEAGQAARTLLEGVPPDWAMEVPDVLALLTPEQKKRFLGI